MKAYSCEADSVPVARRTGCGEVEGVAVVPAAGSVSGQITRWQGEDAMVPLLDGEIHGLGFQVGN